MAKYSRRHYEDFARILGVCKFNEKADKFNCVLKKTLTLFEEDNPGFKKQLFEKRIESFKIKRD